ncbi:uncharacterized protein LOC130623947 [Hydractinia symbiolongicarpus]|uniref:uncharacterized protein LOC130623947 n=1 Tax=Hydractinia symbiolongicarpus TaxID=13093 RepID=UPI0025510629|nr:uncharacterized protein LOC130623947 [Hydractinia symbiolongicarpus]
MSNRKFLNVHFCSLVTVALLLYVFFSKADDTILLRVAYLEQKPFIFTVNNNTKGVLADIMTNGQQHCQTESSRVEISFVKTASSRKEYNQILLQNISTHFKDNITTLWSPVLFSSEASQDLMKMQPDHLLYQIMISKHMVVVVRRYRIELLFKTWQGLLNSSQVAIVTILTAICVGILIWFVERKRNLEISESFFKGAPTGIWCSLVTMTTVGYGDVVPKHFISRILISAWILLALSMAAILTATVSENVSGVSGIDIKNQMVAVLSNSTEAHVAKKVYNSKLILKESYEEVIELVRTDSVYAALLNADVAAAMQSDIINDKNENPLRIVKQIKYDQVIYSAVQKDLNGDSRAGGVIRCMNYENYDDVIEKAASDNQRYCKIDVLYNANVSDMFKENKFTWSLCIIIGVLIVVGIMLEIQLRLIKGKISSKENKKTGTASIIREELHRVKMEILNEI